MLSPTELRTETLATVAGIDPTVMTGHQAAAAVRELATVEKAAVTARMFCALRVAQTDAWRGQGHASAADWLAAQTGISVHEAHRQLGTARRAEQLPKTKEQMRQGKLSPGQADAVASGATADPNAEDDLLASARQDTHATLKEKASKAAAAATDARAREQRIHRERSLRLRTGADGSFSLVVRGPGADGARFQALLRPFEEDAFQSARSTRRSALASGSGWERDTYENRSYDAFCNLLDTCGGGSTDGSPEGSTDGSADGERVEPAKRRSGDNLKVIVRVDHTALLRGHTVAGETCDVAGLGPISVTACRDLMQDAFLAAIVTKGKDVVNVAHLGRGCNAFQRTALEWTGITCTNIACAKTVAIQIDHNTPWATRPETKLDNQDPLCPECHRRKTHHGWHLEPGTGPRRFVPPGPPAMSGKSGAERRRGP